MYFHNSDVIDIFKESLFESCMDEFGCIDFTRTSGMSKSKQVKTFVALLNKVAVRKGSVMFTVPEMMEIGGQMDAMDRNEFADFG